MSIPIHSWPAAGSFRNRSLELDVLEAWWRDRDALPIAMIGRRRVGKSWLFRRFAHGKPALILVAEQLTPGAQLTRFAEVCEGPLGFRPDLPDVASLFRLLHRMARDEPMLAVIDEFPWLLGGTAAEVRRSLTAIQAVLEDERDRSQLKLIVCGSLVSQMESLLGERNPLHGRLRQLDVRPLGFAESAVFLDGLEPMEAFERFAITGGMPMYLSRVGRGPVADAVVGQVLSPDSALFGEGRRIVDQELREPRVYFTILEELTSGRGAINEIGQRIGIETNAVHKYLTTLADLRLVAREVPFGADPGARSGRWRLDDDFLRFWFRFVFPFQSDLESGLPPDTLFTAEISPFLNDHTAPTFERWCRAWVRRTGHGGVTRVGRWWGNAADEFRRSGERTTEEIDIVGSRRNQVVVVGEAKWSTSPLGPSILDDIERYKIPALRTKLKVASRPDIVLMCRGGYSDALLARAEADTRITLVDVGRELTTAT